MVLRARARWLAALMLASASSVVGCSGGTGAEGPDGGLDAAAIDGSHVDAGRDATTDAAAIDAPSTTDAATIDAPSTTDAATIDASSTTDAAAITDASSTTDAAAIDAATIVDAFVPAPPGDDCTSDAECGTHFCVDGVCCATACRGGCMACALSLTGAASGTCAPVRAGTDPHDGCVAASVSSCGTDGSCDGSGTCALYGASTVCTSASCTSDVALPSAHCDGAGHCPTPTPIPCAPYACDATACRSSCSTDVDCASTAPGAWCNAGVCVARGDDGVPCTGDNQCVSNVCADGVCCGTVCNGPCMACASIYTGQADGTCDVIMCRDPRNECPGTSVCSIDGCVPLRVCIGL